MIRQLIRVKGLVFMVSAFVIGAPSLIAGQQDVPAYTVNGKAFTVGDAEKKDQSSFFELEKRKFDRIEEMAREEFLNQFWGEMSKSKKLSLEKTKENYLKERTKVSDKEINDLLEKLKDHPQLSKLPKEEQKKQVREYLSTRESQRVLDDIVMEGIKTGKLLVVYPKPHEPVFQLNIAENEPVRYGPKATDTKPMGCKGDACPITIIEYSEYQCPYCAKMLEDTTKVLEAYKGKIRWYVRDFPLEQIHNRAHPAAVAAKCAHFQGKFWEMYYSLFENQRELGDADISKRAEKLKLDMKKFNACSAVADKAKGDQQSKKAEDMIRANFESGRKYGVEGTPAFFINGRKLSGALPFADFKRVIDEELANHKNN